MLHPTCHGQTTNTRVKRNPSRFYPLPPTTPPTREKKFLHLEQIMLRAPNTNPPFQSHKPTKFSPPSLFTNPPPTLLKTFSPSLLCTPTIFSPFLRFQTPRVYLKPLQSNSNKSPKKSSVLLDSLRVLEWHKVCDSVASFAGTSLGRESTKAQLLCVDKSYDESKHLLAETTAAVEMLKYGVSGMDFSGLDIALVKSATNRAARALPLDGLEAMAIANLLQFTDILQSSLKAAIKEDMDWHNRFMPLTEVVMNLVINRALIKSVQQVIDDDGSVKDSASSDLKRFREQVRTLERKLHQLMDNLIRNELNDTSSLEVSNIDGRWCIKSGADQLTTFKGLLLSSGSGFESLVEPISAVPLNDELQQARALVAKAEGHVLSKLTDKVTARAKYSLAFGGTCPDFSFAGNNLEPLMAEDLSLGKKTFDMASLSYPNKTKWTLYLRKAYHPVLLQNHRENLLKASKDVKNATAEIRRRKLQGESMTSREDFDTHLASLKTRVANLEEAHPVPVDFLVALKTKVVVITGPNTGGKTISLKTVGLAALMAKSGLYVLASEPVRIPWFDSIFADIGDEQSLAQSLSTFSGHLKQISAIRAQSTSNSLVFLDEVGAGTNPLEGAALGMSLLEAFAELGALLTVATTHHGELKALKYSNSAFDNACVEFDEVNLKPTYKILWGIPGRSNAINIAERLGLPSIVIDSARELHGTTSAELNGVIIDMEKFKQDFEQRVHEAKNYLMSSRELHEKLLVAKQKIAEHIAIQRYKKVREISETAAMSRSILHNKLRQFRASESQISQKKTEDNGGFSVGYLHQSASEKQIRASGTQPYQNKVADNDGNPYFKQSLSEKPIKIPEVGNMVYVSALRKKVMVLKVEASKGEIIVQAGNMQLRLKLSDIGAAQ
ncbi:DNA mismatch repair protein MutS, type 2 isoform X2 [Tasmannia lanceolata]|uniref:DNA mismatch repair protein MutS, type 2 isoform X2 n=1 Tax=Tasmannia lanceolata TaxID=3420 RepID=UPI004063D03D